MPNKKKILIVEDTRTQMFILEGLLVDSGFDVETAINGESALAICRESEPRVILTDINMPGMTGYELCKKIKADAQMKASFPVILLESLKDCRSLVDILDSGADGFMYKEFEEEYFIPLLNSLLNEFEMARIEEETQLEIDGKIICSTNRKLQSLLLASFRSAVYLVNNISS